MPQIELFKENQIKIVNDIICEQGWGDHITEIKELYNCFQNNFFLLYEGDIPIGSIFGVKYDNFVVIAYVIILGKYRRNGYASKMLKKLILHFQNQGVSKFILDGVPEICSLYEKVGFRSICKSYRLRGSPIFKRNSKIRPLRKDDLPTIINIDKKYFKADRSSLLEYYFQNYPDLCKVYVEHNQIKSFIMASPRNGFIKIGPWIVTDFSIELQDILKQYGTKDERAELFICILESNSIALSIAKKIGLKITLFSYRMVKNFQIFFPNEMMTLAGLDRG